MHYTAEATFFRLNNKAAIALSRSQRDLLLSKLLDTEEAFASTMPIPLKVGVADNAVKNAMFLEDLKEFESAKVLYKRAERIHREMENSEDLQKVMELQINMLQKQLKQD